MKNKFTKKLYVFVVSLMALAQNGSTAEKIENEAATKLLYLEDTYKFEGEGNVIDKGKDEKKGNYVVLDKTLFYPQGGGQPSDIGVMKINDTDYNVTFVSFLNGKVLHYIKEDISSVVEGSVASLVINPEKRILHAKAHTSGHLLGSVIEKIDPTLIATKGYHFLEGPYVEFEGKSELPNTELIERANAMMTQKIQEGASVAFGEISSEELLKLRGSKFQIPTGKTARIVTIEGFESVPCGGTHIQNLSELNEVSIKKIQNPKGNTKISYTYR